MKQQYLNIFNTPLLDDSNPIIENLMILDDHSIILWLDQQQITVSTELQLGSILITDELSPIT